jgi:predicted GIY-YIG superfamily endonuclease
MFHVYIIVSDTYSERYYIGFSSRPHDRLTEHNAAKNPSTALLCPGVLPHSLVFPQNKRPADSNAISKAVQVARFCDAISSIRAW